MTRWLLNLALVLGIASLAQAHFVYVLPSSDGKSIQVVFSDSLAPDKSVPISKVGGTKLTLRSAGQDQPLKLEQVENYLASAIPGTGTRVIYGHTDYGVVQKGDNPPFRLHYHPKTILGDIFSKDVTLGLGATLEIVPVREGAGVKFLVLSGGQPLTEAEVFLRRPGSEKMEILKTDSTGHTPAYTDSGRYGVVARKIESTAGEHAGKKYQEVRHYATLVADVQLSRP